VQRNFFPLSTLLNASEFLERALQIVIVGPIDDPQTAALRRAAKGSASLPNLLLQQVVPGTELPEGHPAKGKGLRDGKPTAYVCEGPVCSAPLDDAKALAEDLARR
jgi:uncharacterized protein